MHSCGSVSTAHLGNSSITSSDQLELWEDDPNSESAEYLSRQLITCIGNKRALLPQIAIAVNQVKQRLGKPKLRVFDAFSGSGVVSRFLKAHASYLISNDLEHYAAVVARCYLRNRCEVDLAHLSSIVSELNRSVDDVDLPTGFIEDLYAPKHEDHITADDRVFYTKRNAKRIDNFRRLINDYPSHIRNMLLGPLLSKASIHTNTAGVFKGFYKDRLTKIGRFGGSGSDAMSRIKGEIRLEVPLLSKFTCDYEVWNVDANSVADGLNDFDLAYADPPYNQHPYGSNYFMLNLIAKYERPDTISIVSGIPNDWIRSGYNVRAKSFALLMRLLREIDSRFLLVSFNDEGFITMDEMRSSLARLGRMEVIETRYNTFRGSRNLRNRSIHVTEHLFLVDRR